MKRFYIIGLTVALTLNVVTAVEAKDAGKARKQLAEGKRLLAAGKYEQAVISLEKAYDLGEDHKVLLPIAEAEEKLGNLKRAVGSLKRFLEKGGSMVGKKQRQKVERDIARLEEKLEESSRNASNKREAARLFREGVVHKNDGQHALAVSEFEKAYDLYPNYKIHSSRAESLAALGKYEEAIAAYRAYLDEGAKKLDSADRQAAERDIAALERKAAGAADANAAKEHYQDGREFYAKGQYARARFEFDRAHKLDPTYRYLYPLAKAQLKLGEDDDALASLERYLAEGGSSIDAKKRGKVQREIARLEKRRRDASQKERARELYDRGIAKLEAREYSAAADSLRQAYETYPSYKMLYPLAQAEAQAENFDRALSAYKKYLADGRGKLPAKREKTARVEVKRLEDLVARAKDRTKSAGHFRAGKKLARAGKDKQANAEFAKAFDLYPSYRILYTWSKSLLAAGKAPEALSKLELYLELGGEEIAPDRRLNVENEIARLRNEAEKKVNAAEAKRRYAEGVALRKKGKYAAAVKELSKAYQLVNSYKVLYELGLAREGAGQLEKAVDALDRYLDEGGDAISDKRRAAAQAKLDELGGALQRSEKKAESRAHYEKAITLRKEERHAAAAKELESAYELYPSFKLLYHLARSYADASDYALAVNNYVDYLHKGGDQVDDNRKAKVKEQLAELYQHVGIIELKCPVDGATVSVNSQVVAETPLGGVYALEPGSHSVVVDQEGSILLAKEVDLAGGGSVTLEVDTEMLAARDVAAESESILDDEDDLEDDGGTKRVWTWVAAGIGGAGLIGGIVTGALALQAEEDADATMNKYCEDGVCPVAQSDEINDAREKVQPLGITTDVLLGVGFAGLAVGTLLFFFEDEWFGDGEAKVDVAITPTVQRDAAGLSLGGTF